MWYFSTTNLGALSHALQNMLLERACEDQRRELAVMEEDVQSMRQLEEVQAQILSDREGLEQVTAQRFCEWNAKL